MASTAGVTHYGGTRVLVLVVRAVWILALAGAVILAGQVTVDPYAENVGATYTIAAYIAVSAVFIAVFGELLEVLCDIADTLRGPPAANAEPVAAEPLRNPMDY